MYRDKEGKIRFDGSAWFKIALFIIGIIIGFNLSQGINGKAAIWSEWNKADWEDVRLLANVMYFENGNNTDEAILLTGSVVINRVKKGGWYPSTIKGVLYQKNPVQYSTTGMFFTKPIPPKFYLMAIRLLMFGSIAPPNVLYQSRFHQGSGDYKIINGEYFCYE